MAASTPASVALPRDLVLEIVHVLSRLSTHLPEMDIPEPFRFVRNEMEQNSTQTLACNQRGAVKIPSIFDFPLTPISLLPPALFLPAFTKPTRLLPSQTSQTPSSSASFPVSSSLLSPPPTLTESPPTLTESLNHTPTEPTNQTTPQNTQNAQQNTQQGTQCSVVGPASVCSDTDRRGGRAPPPILPLPTRPVRPPLRIPRTGLLTEPSQLLDSEDSPVSSVPPPGSVQPLTDSETPHRQSAVLNTTRTPPQHAPDPSRLVPRQPSQSCQTSGPLAFIPGLGTQFVAEEKHCSSPSSPSAPISMSRGPFGAGIASPLEGLPSDRSGQLPATQPHPSAQHRPTEPNPPHPSRLASSSTQPVPVSVQALLEKAPILGPVPLEEPTVLPKTQTHPSQPHPKPHPTEPKHPTPPKTTTPPAPVSVQDSLEKATVSGSVSSDKSSAVALVSTPSHGFSGLDNVRGSCPPYPVSFLREQRKLLLQIKNDDADLYLDSDDDIKEDFSPPVSPLASSLTLPRVISRALFCSVACHHEGLARAHDLTASYVFDTGENSLEHFVLSNQLGDLSLEDRIDLFCLTCQSCRAIWSLRRLNTEDGWKQHLAAAL